MTTSIENAEPTLDNVPNPDAARLILEGEAAATAYAKSGRENILPMARGLVAARQIYRSDQQFGYWFKRSPYSEVVTNHSMRAALIFIGEHEDIATPIIKNSRSVDPEAIAEKIKVSIESVSEILKPASTSEPQEETALTSGARVTKRSSFRGKKRADADVPIVVGIYADPESPNGVGLHIIKGKRDLGTVIADGQPKRFEIEVIPFIERSQAVAAEQHHSRVVLHAISRQLSPDAKG